MATSRSEPGAGLSIPETATADEAAAIAAAVGAHLRDRQAAAVAAAGAGGEDGEGDGERLSPWAMAGRREGLTRGPGRAPAGAPSDSWTALTRYTQLNDD